MILGVGTDILDMRRLSPSSLAPGDPFLRRAFTEREIAQAQARPHPLKYYATRFAGKEAVFKALGTAPDWVRRGTEIEILDDCNGAPHCSLSGAAGAWAEKRGAKAVHISLSWDGELAVACAVLEGGEEKYG